MSKKNHRNALRAAAARSADAPTHLVARTNGRPRFRRCGIEFTANWQAFPLQSLDPAVIKRLAEEEAMLQVHLVTKDQLEDFEAGNGKVPGADTATVASLRERIAELEAELGKWRSGELVAAPQTRIEIPGADSPRPE